MRPNVPTIGVGFLVLGFAVGCNGDKGSSDECPPCPSPDARVQQCPDGGGHHDEDGGTNGRRQLAFSMDVGHIHAYRDVDMTFTVRDLSNCDDPMDRTTCAPVSGLPVKGIYRGVGWSETRTQELEQDVLVDNGDGTYTWTRSFSSPGAWMAGLKLENDGSHYKAAFPVHVSKAGGERIFCPSKDNADFNYQIRWAAEPGHVHAGDEVTIDLELKRSFGTVNTDQPWENSFDHLRPENLANTPLEVQFENDAGDVLATKEASYMGEGIYRVQWTAVDSVLGDGDHGHVTLHVTFTDDQSCTVDETGVDYQLPVAAPH